MVDSNDLFVFSTLFAASMLCYDAQYTPKQIEGVSKVVGIAAGSTFHYCTTQFNMTYFWGIKSLTGESTIRPKPLADLSGFKVRSLACGRTSTIVAGETTLATWGPSPCFGELGYGDKLKRGGSIVKTSTKVKVVDSLDGGHVECVAMGSCFSAILIRRETAADEKLVGAFPILDEIPGPSSAAENAGGTGKSREVATRIQKSSAPRRSTKKSRKKA